MSIIKFPTEKSADSFTTNYWFLSNPAKPELEPIRVLHNEKSMDELLNMNLDGFEIGFFIPENVSSYLGFEMVNFPKELVIGPDGKRKEYSLVGPLLIQRAGNIGEQTARKESPGNYPEPDKYENVMAYVWENSVILSPFKKVKT